MVLSIGAALTMSGDAVSLIQERLRSIAAAYGYPRARISLFPTLLIVALRDGEAAVSARSTVDASGDWTRHPTSSRSRAAPRPPSSPPPTRCRNCSTPRFGTVAYIASHGVLTIGLGLVIHPAAVDLAALAFLAQGGDEAASLRLTIPPLVTFLPGALLTMVTVDLLPAFWLLVPGAIGLIGITEIVGTNASLGSENFLSALVSIPSIALGVLVGTMVVRAFNTRPGARLVSRLAG
jgi:hypothetical protein